MVIICWLTNVDLKNVFGINLELNVFDLIIISDYLRRIVLKNVYLDKENVGVTMVKKENLQTSLDKTCYYNFWGQIMMHFDC